MICLPNELFFHIFKYITNKQDLLQCQLVCYAFLEPARRSFYKKITIQELWNHSCWNEINPFQLIKFIHSMAQCLEGSSRIPLPGLFVQTLHVNFEIPLESYFMPTTAEFQLLAAACPNIEELQFPGNMFWNSVLSLDNSLYWKKVRSISHTMNETNMQKFIHFRLSLTFLPVDGWQYQQQQQYTSLLDVVRQFPHLETLQIMNRSFSINHLHDVIPTLLQSPHISNLIMTSSGSPPPPSLSSSMIVSTLSHLDLTLTEDAPYLTLLSIKEIFTYLNRLILCFTPHTERNIESDDSLFRALAALIRFTFGLVSDSHLRLFIHNYNAMHRIAKHAFYHNRLPPNLIISYSNCSSSLTGQPGIELCDQQRLYLRYQSYVGGSGDLPHMTFLRDHGEQVRNLSIQGPAACVRKPTRDVETMLLFLLPQLTVLRLTHYYVSVVSVLPLSLVSQLHHLTLERCLIASDTCYQIATACPDLAYLTLNNCFTNTEDHVSSVYMPTTRFKKLVIINDTSSSGGGGKKAVVVAQKTTKTVLFSTTTHNNDDDEEETVHLYIQCLSIDEFIFNSFVTSTF